MLQAAGSNSLVSLSDELMQSLAFQCIDYSVEFYSSVAWDWKLSRRALRSLPGD